MIKKILFLIFSTVLVASCSKNSTETPSVEWKSASVVTGSGFSIAIPSWWSSSGTLEALGNPQTGKILLAAVSPTKKYNLANNIIIMEDDLEKIGSSAQYTELNNFQTQKKYSEYSLVTTGPVLFSDSDESKYYVFDAKYNTNAPKVRFIQSAKICGTKAYLIHILLAAGTNPTEYIPIIKTFTCK